MDLRKHLDLGILFDQAIKSYGFDQCPNESYVYKKCDGSVVVFLVLYVDDILLIGNDVGVFSSVKVWLSSQFDMKDVGEASHILGIKLLRDGKQRMLGLSQATYIDHILACFSMQDSKKVFFLSDMESLYPTINVPKHLMR